MSFAPRIWPRCFPREAIATVVAEIDGRAPNFRARNADELHELIRTHGFLSFDDLSERTSVESAKLLAELEETARIIRIRRRVNSPEVLFAAEDRAMFAAIYPDGGLDRQCVTTEGVTDESAARIELIRRTLATSGPCTVAELEQHLQISRSQIESALIALEAQGVVFRGHFTKIADGAEQWCDRYVLERIHRRTLSRLRDEVEPCADHEFATFRVSWQHLGGNELEPGANGVRTVLEQLAGLAVATEFWEKSILPARVIDYRSEHLDLLCMSGEFGWRAAPLDNNPETQPFPSRISFVARRGQPYPPAEAAQIDDRDRAILDALEARGAQYLDQVAERANRSERDTLASLWRLAAAGLVSNDSFAPLRLLSAEPEAVHAAVGSGGLRAVTRQDAAVRARLKSSLSGRWSATTSSHYSGDGSSLSNEAGNRDRTREIATTLLARHGILSREMLALESIDVSWRDLAFALRRMEYAGLIRRGWFVRALSGEQYATPEALEMLRAIRFSSRDQKLVAFSAVDPANPYGVLLPGCGIARDPDNLIVLRGGRVMLGLSGRTIYIPASLDSDSMHAGVAALIRLRPILRIETIGEIPALESDYVGIFAAMRFHSDGRALVYDGLPGPVPARALSPVARA